MTRLTEFALRQKSVVILVAVGLFLAGIFAWGQLQQELIPDIQLPIVSVITALPGAGAEDVATQVTEPVEQALANVPRLKTTQSTSANSLSLVVTQFDFGTNIKDTVATIEQQLAQASLPQGSEPRVTAFDINQQPVIIATIGPAAGADPTVAATIARDVLLPQIRALDGVAGADLTGGPTRTVQITLDPAKMAANGISLNQVTGLIAANQIAIPSGTIVSGGLRLPISTEHRFTSLDELRSLVVGVQGGAAAAAPGGAGQPAATPAPGASGGTTTPPAAPTPVTLGEIATVDLADQQESGFARTNGQPSLTLSVTKATGANTVAVADEVQRVIDDVSAQHGNAIAISKIQDLAAFIKQSRDGLVREGLLGAIFAVLTIFLFLLSLRSTIVAAISIPLSILTALALFGVFGLTINIITLGGLAVAVGRVVDDAIVVLENIFRHRARGDAIGVAVRSGTAEVARAISSSTLTTIAVFLPIGFVGGIVSQFFLPFGVAVTLALAASLGVALTIVPVLAFFLLRKVTPRVNPEGELPETIWQRLYTPVLRTALRSRVTKWATIGIAFGLFAGSLALVPLLPTGFINVGGEKIVTVSLAPPSGATSDALLAHVVKAENVLLAQPEVDLVQSTIPTGTDTGSQALRSAFTGRAANSPDITVRLHPSADIDKTSDSFRTLLAPVATDGYAVSVDQQQAFGTGGLSVIVSGADPAAIRQASDALVAGLSTMSGVANVRSDLAQAAPQVQVTVDPNKAAGVGMTTAQVGGLIRSVLTGQPLGIVSLADGTVAQAQAQIDTSKLASLDALKLLPIGTGSLRTPLGQIADVRQVDVQGSVTRVDGAPAATISGSITSKDQGAISTEAQKRITALQANGTIPSSVTVRLAGVTQQQNEAFGNLFFSMGVAILVVYIVMVFVFGSLIDPFVILFSLPLATIGAFPALLITGHTLGISALIGFLMLIGIVVTNAIVLLDLVEQMRRRGLSTQDALIQGGRTRVRPILMTAVATIMALTPVALGLSEGSIIAGELGIVVIGGLFSSTALTLIVIPVIYSLVDGGKQAFARRFEWARPASEDNGAVTTPAPAPTPTPAA